MPFKVTLSEEPAMTGDAPTANAILRAEGIKLVLEDVSESNTPKWQHVANEGQFLGYRHGEDPFAFTRETFIEMIRNFRNHPQFKAGPDGVGVEDVVPWDFEHASEYYAAEGSIPATGTPAQGWIKDLKVVTGPNGKAELWALTLFLPTALEYIRNGQYKWSSVSVIMNAVDPVSGERVGAVLTSVALTNHPFIQSLEPLAASANNGIGLRVNSWWDAAGNATEAVDSLKTLFGLKELSTIPEVVSEISKLRQIVEMGAPSIGIDLPGIFGALRQILNMGALTSELEVLDALEKITQRAIEKQAIANGTGISQNVDSALETLTASGAESKGEEKMLKKLGLKLGVNEIEGEVIAATDDLITLKKNVGEIVGENKNSEIVDEVRSLKAVSQSHTTILKALGADSSEDAVSKIGELGKAEKALKDLQPKYDDLNKRIEQIDLKAAENDVDMVIAANGFNENLKDALLLHRQNDPDGFAAKFPVDHNTVKLTQNLTVENGDTQTPQQTQQVPQGDTIDLSLYPGVNNSERAKSYLASINPAFHQASHENQTLAAHNLLKRPNVINK